MARGVGVAQRCVAAGLVRAVSERRELELCDDEGQLPESGELRRRVLPFWYTLRIQCGGTVAARLLAIGGGEALCAPVARCTGEQQQCVARGFDVGWLGRAATGRGGYSDGGRRREWLSPEKEL